MTTVQREYIISEYTCGRNNPTRIAKELGMKSKNVSTFAYVNGLTKKKRKWTEDDETYIREHWIRKEYHGLQRIAQTLGCKVYDVENRIRKMRKEHRI